MTAGRPSTPTVAALAARLSLHDGIIARYGAPLRELLKLWKVHPDGFDELVLCVLNACEAAREHLGVSDINAERRRRDRQVLADLPRALDALEEFRRFVQHYPEHVGWATVHLILELREDGIRFGMDGARIMPTVEMLQRMLEVLDKSLRNNLLAGHGPFLHRFQEGALVFDQPRDQQDRSLGDPVLTTLMFELVFLFRRFTAGVTKRRESLYAADPRMPTDGQPCYRLAVAFVDAALDRHTEDVRSLERRFKKWQRANPDAAWGHWPREHSPPKKP